MFALKLKNTKKLKIPAPCLIRFYLVIMTSPSDMTSLGEILTFEQKVGESFKNAWERISEPYKKMQPRIELSVLLIFFTLVLHLCINML